MQEPIEFSDLVGFLVTIVIGIFVLRRVVSRLRNKIRRFERRWHRGSSGRASVGRTTRREPSLGGQLGEQTAGTSKRARSAAAVSAQLESFPKYDVDHVIDGDTVVVSNTWVEIRVRLDSIDCPEDDQHWGNTARYGLIKLIGGKEIRLEEHGQDHHGRTLGTLYVRTEAGAEWMNVNERMVTLGHAWVMRRFYGHLPKDRQAKLNRLERWAKSKKVGLWKTNNPTAPWHWRNGRKLSDASETRES